MLAESLSVTLGIALTRWRFPWSSARSSPLDFVQSRWIA
jgi:hypothetical protein